MSKRERRASPGVPRQWFKDCADHATRKAEEYERFADELAASVGDRDLERIGENYMMAQIWYRTADRAYSIWRDEEEWANVPSEDEGVRRFTFPVTLEVK